MTQARSQILIAAKDETRPAFISASRNVSQLSATVTAGNRVVQGFLAGAVVSQAGQFTKAVIDSRIEVDRLRSMMSASVGARNMGSEMAFLRVEAERLGIPLQESAESYSKLAIAAQGTTLAGQGVRDIFSAISGAAATMNSSAADTEGMLRAIVQMMSKGKVQAEELRGQLGDRLPGAFQAAARAAGVTVAEFDQMLEQGKVFSEDFLPKFAAELNRTFGSNMSKVMDTAQAAVSRLGNAWKDLKQTVAEGPIGDVAMKLVEGLTDEVKGYSKALKEAKDANLNWYETFIHIAKAIPRTFGFMPDAASMLETQSRSLLTPENNLEKKLSEKRYNDRNAATVALWDQMGFEEFGSRQYSREGERGARVAAETASRRASMPAWDKLRAQYDEGAKIKAITAEITEAGRRAGQTDIEIKKLIATATTKKGTAGRSEFAKDMDQLNAGAETAAKALAKMQLEVSGFHGGEIGKVEKEILALEDKLSGLKMVGGSDKDAQRGISSIENLIAIKKQEIEVIREKQELESDRTSYEETIAAIEKAADSAKQETDAARDRLELLRHENETRGLLGSTIEAMAIARLNEKIAIESGLDGNAKVNENLVQQLRLREQIGEQLKIKEAVEANEELTRKRIADDKKAAEDARSEAERLGLVFTSAFEDAVVEGKNLRGVLQGIEKDIVRLIIRKGITEPFLKSGTSGGWLDSIAGLLGINTGSTWRGGGGGDVPSDFSGSGFEYRANGGSVLAGKSYIVGERGPERLTMGADGWVTPNHKLGGGTKVVQHFDMRGSADSENLVRRAAALGAASARASIFDDRVRGGKAFA